MYLLYTKSSKDDYARFRLQGGMFLCKDDTVRVMAEHQEMCDGEVHYRYYVLNAETMDLYGYKDSVFDDNWFYIANVTEMSTSWKEAA